MFYKWKVGLQSGECVFVGEGGFVLTEGVCVCVLALAGNLTV